MAKDKAAVEGKEGEILEGLKKQLADLEMKMVKSFTMSDATRKRELQAKIAALEPVKEKV